MTPRKRFPLLMVGIVVLMIVSVTVAFANPLVISQTYVDVVRVHPSADQGIVYYGGYWGGFSGTVNTYDTVTGQTTTLVSLLEISKAEPKIRQTTPKPYNTPNTHRSIPISTLYLSL